MTEDPSNRPAEALPLLRTLLRERLAIIGDHGLRERDPAGQLARLGAVSAELTAAQERFRKQLPARLNHFLERASFQKALEFIETGGG